MDLWTFKGFIENDGNNVIDGWYAELPTNVQAKLDWIIDMFRVRELSGWRAKYFKELKPEIYEIRFEINRIAYRPLGAFVPERRDFCFLIGATKKNNRLIPEGAEITALNRLKAIKDNPRLAGKCKFIYEDNEESIQQIEGQAIS